MYTFSVVPSMVTDNLKKNMLPIISWIYCSLLPASGFAGFNLDRLQEVVNEADLPPGLVTLRHTPRVTNKNATPATSTAPSKTVAPPSKLPTREAGTLSSKEIERDRGKPLSKYERNVMIFDWLHTLDESATVDFNWTNNKVPPLLRVHFLMKRTMAQCCEAFYARDLRVFIVS